MRVRLAGKQSIYLDIAEQYKHYINMNVLKKDEKLPSCRALALELGINPNTVERAYAILETEGYIKNLPKKGSFVCGRDNFKNDLLKSAQNQIEQLKTAGITYEQLIDMVENAYKEEKQDDRNQ